MAGQVGKTKTTKLWMKNLGKFYVQFLGRAKEVEEFTNF
jgi:hypothetical protein